MKAALATPEPLVVPDERGMLRAALFVATFGFLWFVLCRLLSGEWSVNEQYNYGWFVPFFCAYLFWLRWEDRPRAEIPKAKFQSPNHGAVALVVAIAALLLLLPLRVFEVGNPDWRPLGWIHALIVVTLTLLALGWIGGGAWVRHFAFPVAFILVAVPWISPIEQPVVQGLMRTIAAAATEALTLCGIPAQLEGNLIRISSGVVGVNEACSGVRALQTALMIGLLLGELKRFSLGRRAVLVAVAIVLSILANFLRTFLLVLIAANQGIGAVDRWHDVAGYSIVALVFLGTMAAAALLGRSQRSEVRGQRSLSEKSGFGFRISDFGFPPRACLIGALCWLIVVEVASAAWYRAHERNLVERTRWSVRWPSSQESFRDLKIEESVRQTLRFDEGRAGRWIVDLSGSSENGAATKAQEAPLRCTLFFFRWNAGGGTLLRARAHRPEICLPSTGWEQTADHAAHSYLVQPGVALPFRHLEFVHKGRRPFEADQFAHTFFCLQQDWMEAKNSFGPRSALIASESGDWSVRARVRAVEQGLRDLGQQTMEVVFIAAQPLDAAAAEAKFGELIPQLIKVEQVKAAGD